MILEKTTMALGPKPPNVQSQFGKESRYQFGVQHEGSNHNKIEPWTNSQIKRRTRVVGIFPSEESLERLVTGVLIEISENWESGRVYLKNEQI